MGQDEFKQLQQKRRNWVEANRENGFDEGINRLLTELYPDNAHFIYELLQNAEDPEATEVQFTLTDSGVEFAHNGKRLFSFRDVESITSIGNSTKRDDATSIGKFGVGFKAVFAYTNTPEIHSGDYHFRIRDLVVPDTEDVEQSASNPNQTRFLFPFDNPKKPATTAVQEISKGLCALGDNTLLFLSHIRKIEYLLPDASLGSLERFDCVDGRIEIRATHPSGKTQVSYWLHFHKDVYVTDDDGKSKTCRIAIAYSLAEETNKKIEEKKWKIVPLPHGQVSIYFPAEKETSNLKIHLHAPFASTVARDSVRDCPANKQLRDHLAKLVVESLTAIRDQGMLTVGFLAVLPNPADNLANFYEPIREVVVSAFKNHSLTPTRSGSYAPSTSLYRGPVRIANVLNDNDLSLLTGNKVPLWTTNPQQQNQREDRFLESLQIRSWSWNELAKVLNSASGNQQKCFEDWIEKKDDKWLLNFYALLGETCSTQRQKLSVGNLRLIKVQGNKMVIPSQAFFPATEDVTAPSDILIVDHSVYQEGKVEEQKKLAKLFLEAIGIRPFDVKEVIKKKLAYYDKQPTPNYPDHVKDIKMFVEYWQKNPPQNIQLFKNKKFLLGKEKGNKPHWCQASELYLDKPFVDTGLRKLFNDPSIQLEKYKKELFDGYQFLPNIAEFAVALGVMEKLEIGHHDATAMQANVIHQSGRKTKTTEDKDYYINALNPNRGQWWHNKGSVNYLGELPVYKKIMPLSQVVWKTVCKAKPEQLVARYLPNQSNSHQEKKTEAFFIKQLTECAWVPDTAGNFLKPADVTEETLHPDFIYDNSNGWLTAVKFGENARKRSEEYQAKNKKAQEMGFESAEQAAKFAELAKRGISPDELMAQQKRAEQPEESVPNPERRRKGVLERSENAPSKESVMRERAIQPGIASVVAEAKAYLRAKYTNTNHELVCQCCQQEMPFKIGDAYYFEAVQCIKTIENHHIENRLALCPTCAAMYQHARAIDDTELRRLIVEHDAPDNANSVEIPLTLATQPHRLRFVGTHFFDLKTVLSTREK